MADHTKQGNYWKYAVIGLVTLFVVAMIVTLALASRRVSRVVDREYYVHGLDYQREGEQLANGVRLGWRLETAYADGIIRLRATDGAGRPVSGGRVALRNVERGGMPQGGSGSAMPGFTEESPGVYRARVVFAHPGDLRGQVMVSRGNAAVAARLVLLR